MRCEVTWRHSGRAADRSGTAWGFDTEGSLYLVEAKAHRAELTSTCQASPGSRALIDRSLASAKAAFGARPDAQWACGYYQYANRLAHLHFLRSRGVPAKLVFLYFTNDADMAGPATADEWRSGTAGVAKQLGLDSPRLEGMFNVYVDCRQLA